MGRLLCLFLVPALLTVVIGYPSSVPSVQDFLPREHVANEEALEIALDRKTDLNMGESASPAFPDQIRADKPFADNVNLRQESSPVNFVSESNPSKEKSYEETSAEEDDDDSDMFMEPQETDEEVVKTDDMEVRKEVSTATSKDNHGMGQHFFPSFAPVFSLGHSRPPQLFHQENYYSKSRAPTSLGPDYNPFRAYRESSYKVPITFDDDPISSNILGSGNFGVLKGGTYYNEEDRGEFFNPYYSNNGHGRPYSANPRPQKYSNGDFFANFRDFADINTPNKASFSEYVIVYVNKNASKTDEGTEVLPPGKTIRPKNIIEQLSMLDSPELETLAPEKKVSLHKRKLALLHQEKANKEKKSNFKKKEPLEPLLALS